MYYMTSVTFGNGQVSILRSQKDLTKVKLQGCCPRESACGFLPGIFCGSKKICGKKN